MTADTKLSPNYRPTADKVPAETGACQYCRSLGIPCEADPRSRKRPFYRVSGDVYDHSIKLLRRFVPEDALPELTVDNIQALLQKLDSDANYTPATPAPTAPAPPPGESEAGRGHGEPVGSNDAVEADQQPLLRKPDGERHHTPETPAPTAAALLSGDGAGRRNGDSRVTSSVTEANTQPELRNLEAGANHTSKTPAAPSPGDDELGLVPGDPAGSSDVMEADEHPLLQEELGCMLLDSMGKYRAFLSYHSVPGLTLGIV